MKAGTAEGEAVNDGQPEFDLLNVLAALGRQWPVLLLALFLVAATTAVVWFKLPPTYQATGTVVLIPPGDPKSGVNSYDHFTSAYIILAVVLSDSVNSDDAVARLKAEGLSAKYTVTTDPQAPTITVVSTDSDPAKTEATMRAVIDQVATFLRVRQAATGAAPTTWVTVSPVSVPSSPMKTAATLRIAVIVAVLGLLAAVSLTVLADHVARARRRRLEATRRPVALQWRHAAPPVREKPRRPLPGESADTHGHRG